MRDLNCGIKRKIIWITSRFLCLLQFAWYFSIYLALEVLQDFLKKESQYPCRKKHLRKLLLQVFYSITYFRNIVVFTRKKTLLFLGMVFAIASTSSDDSLIKCLGNNTAEVFKDCFDKNKQQIFTEVNFEAEQKLLMTSYGIYDILVPLDGSISSFSPAPTLHLNNSFEYFIFLFDNKFVFPFNSPLIAKRTFMRIRPNTSMFIVNLKVRYPILRLHRVKLKSKD